MKALKVFAVMLSISVVALSVAACGSTGPQNTTVNVTLKEMSITVDKNTVPYGKVTFVVTNSGTVAHEMVILKTHVAADKLTTSDGRVNENAYTSPGEVDDVAVGTTKSGTFQLEPGTYVLICNVPGHYMAGMHMNFMVK